MKNKQFLDLIKKWTKFKNLNADEKNNIWFVSFSLSESLFVFTAPLSYDKDFFRECILRNIKSGFIVIEGENNNLNVSKKIKKTINCFLNYAEFLNIKVTDFVLLNDDKYQSVKNILFK